MDSAAFRDAAAYYVGLGWQVFPLKAGLKIPATTHGFKDASDDTNQVDAWAAEHRDCNIAIATGTCSGIFVVDIDPRNGGTETIAALARKGCVFPTCPEVRTGNGGRHLFFALTHPIRASKNRLGAGIDIKSDGGYVVAAPSVITPEVAGASGAYTWLLLPNRRGCPPPPVWLVRTLMPKPKPLPKFEERATSSEIERSLERLSQFVAQSAKGERNNKLYWAVRASLRAGASPGNVLNRMIAAGQSTGLDAKEIQLTFMSGLRAEQSQG